MLEKKSSEKDDEREAESEDSKGSFLGGCLQEAEALGYVPDASKRHQGPRGPYTRHSRECLDGGTTECPRCSRPWDLLKQQGGKSTRGVSELRLRGCPHEF